MRAYFCVLGVLFSLTTLSACGAPPAGPIRAPAGSSEMFQKGYLMGCMSGRHDANPSPWGYSRDPALYDSVPDFHTAWDQAHDACYEYERRAPRMIGDS